MNDPMAEVNVSIINEFKKFIKKTFLFDFILFDSTNGWRKYFITDF
jgi:hypothetical protein